MDINTFANQLVANMFWDDIVDWENIYRSRLEIVSQSYQPRHLALVTEIAVRKGEANYWPKRY